MLTEKEPGKESKISHLSFLIQHLGFKTGWTQRADILGKDPCMDWNGKVEGRKG